MKMNCQLACQIISDQREDSIVVATMSAMHAFDSFAANPLNLSSVPLMGGASSLGLGLAIARPERRVIVVDGDASLLMELGSLVNIAERKPTNFYHFVINNGVQFAGRANLPTPGLGQADFAEIARACGYRAAYRLDDAEALANEIGGILASDGPVMIDLRIDVEPPCFSRVNPQYEIPDRQFTRMGSEARLVMKALGGQV